MKKPPSFSICSSRRASSWFFSLAIALLPNAALADQGECVQPVTTGASATARDCLYVLQVSVGGGSPSCDTTCICDADGDHSIDATDALLCLRHAVGIHDVALCSLCAQSLPALNVITRGVAQIPQDEYFICPTELGFSILLAGDGQGWVSLEGPTIDANVFAAEWKQVGANVQITAASPHVRGVFQYDPYYWVDVGWRDLAIQAADTNADGIADSGTATATITCQFSNPLIDLNEETPTSFTLAPDDATPMLRLTDSSGLQPLYTFADSISARASRPLLRDTLATAGLLVNGTPQAANASVFEERGPFAAGITLDPVDPIPFGATLALDPGAAIDASGNAAAFDGVTVQTVSDPGPLTANPSFEATGGWIGLQTGSNAGFIPVDGQHYAYVSQGHELVGYVDVPNDANTLRFSAGIHEYLGYCPGSASVAFASSIGTVQVFPPADPTLEPCDDCVFGDLVPWTDVSVDLQSLRGQRIVIRAEPSSYTECAPDLYEEPVLDDFRIE